MLKKRFFQAVAHTVGFIGTDSKKRTHLMANTMFMCDEWLVRRKRSFTVCLLLSFALFSKMQFKMSYKENNDRCKIHRTDKTYLKLVSFSWGNVAKRFLSSCDHISLIRGWNQRWIWRPGESHFNKRLRSIIIFLHLILKRVLLTSADAAKNYAVFCKHCVPIAFNLWRSSVYPFITKI